MGVYVLFDDAGNIAYIGRSSRDITERARRSAKARGLDVRKAVLIPINNKAAAWALEDLGIRHNKMIGKGQNKINSMSRRNMGGVMDRYRRLGEFLGRL